MPRMARAPEFKDEFERLQADARVAKAALPVIEAAQASTGEFPAYARGRLQTKVRETLGRQASTKEANRGLPLVWRWALGLGATAVVLFTVLPMFRAPSAPVFEVAMLDTAGGTRGMETNDLAVIEAEWRRTPIRTLSSIGEMEAWEKDWPRDRRRSGAKIIYDRAAGEVKVMGYSKGNPFEKTFLVETNLAVTLRQVSAFVRQQIGT